MPVLDVSEINIIVSVLGGFMILYGIISVLIKQVWYLGEALPAVLFGIILGPVAAKFIDSERWGSAVEGQTSAIMLGVARVVIGVQLVIAGYQLPMKYLWIRWRDMLIVLLPVMTIMWLCTTGCILAAVPKLTLLNAMVIGSMVTCTDPVLSQAIAKGPFADKYVPRALREIISSEAGANDGFGFPFLLLATYLIRYAPQGSLEFKHHGANLPSGEVHHLMTRNENVGRLEGGTGRAIQEWVVEGWLYFIFTGAVLGAFLGLMSMYIVNFVLKKKWIDNESLLLYPTALGLFTIGVCGLTGLDDLLACFIAGAFLNWNGKFLDETLERHDEVNGSIDILLNFGGFMLIGAIMPWSEFHQPDVTGITIGRLIGLGFLVLFLRRIPAIMAVYKFMPHTIKSWKEALFAGYFGPIGIGAVFYVEHAFHLFPHLEDTETVEEENMLRAMRPVVYFLVLFSIVVHGLSIPALELLCRWKKVEPIVEIEPVTERSFSVSSALPNNAYIDARRGSVVRHNRFSRAVSRDRGMSFEDLTDRYGKDRQTSRSRPPPEAPIFRLTSTTDVQDNRPMSPEAPLSSDTDPARQKSIQFVDAYPMRGRKTNEENGRPSTSGFGRPSISDVDKNDNSAV